VDSSRFRELSVAIAAAPDEDAPRLVLADWLQSQGDLRGELVAIQVKLARADSDDLVQRDRDALARRSAKLLAENYAAWIQPLRDIAPAAYYFRRGVVERMTGLVKRPFDQVAGALRDAGALPRAAVAQPNEVPGLLLTPASRCFTEIELGVGAELGRDRLAQVAESLVDLRSVDIQLAREDNVAWDALAELPLCLDHLGVRHTPGLVWDNSGDRFVERLGRASARRSLRSLRLENFSLREGALALPALESLELASVAFEPSLEAFFQLASSLTALSIENVELALSNLEEILAACPNLRHLKLRNMSFGPEAGAIVARSRICKQLRRLDLSKNPLGDVGLRALLDGDFSSLVSLIVPKKGVHPPTVSAYRERFAAIELVMR
jgi:uncharacterized protein (TIGR02996 family)